MSNFRSLYSLDFSNCQCRLVAPSFPTVTQPDFGGTIPWLFSSPYELYSDISEPQKLHYIIIKVVSDPIFFKISPPTSKVKENQPLIENRDMITTFTSDTVY